MYKPLADEIRPSSLDDVVGQRHILGRDGMLRRIVNSGQIPNMIFYGPSGTGKTTILKILNRIVEADSGSFTLGSKVHIGYYDQEHNVLHPEKTIFQEISDAYPTLNNTRIRNVLAAFLFKNDDVFKLISSLSGGERGRVSLAKLMLSEANFLILDEHTAALDPKTADIIMELTDKVVREKNLTAMMVTHNLRYAAEYGDRLIMLDKGHIVIDRSGEEKKDTAVGDILKIFNEISIECGN